MGRLRRESWWMNLTGLRDKLTHQGLVIHHFTLNLGGPEPSSSAHLEIRGKPGDKELRESAALQT